MQYLKKCSAIFLIFILSVQLLAACSPREEPSDSLSQEDTTSSARESSTPKANTVATITPSFGSSIEQSKEINEDTIGWLAVPGTNIEDAVLHKPDDSTNKFYLRKDIYKNYNFDGVYYVDYRSTFGDGTREQLGVNTTIYGHAMTDDPEKETYDVKFGNLHEFRDIDFAKRHPYIYFSTGAEDMVFEIIAVFTANADNTGNAYNDGSKTAAEYVKMIKEEIFPRSKYDYGVEISETDKFLSLSTCIYTLDNGTATGYPDTYYRYVILARLVDPDAPLKETVDILENEDVVIDPDGKWTK